jgi:hypothetical protein
MVLLLLTTSSESLSPLHLLVIEDTNARQLQYEVSPKALEDKNNDGVINAADDALLQPDDDFGFNEGITYYGP